MMRLGLIVGALALALSVRQAPAAAAPPPDPQCLIHMSDVPHPLRFEDFPATPWRAAHYAKPILDTRAKRMYRTRIREGAAEGPNFAGRYKIAIWWAGTSNHALAFIDEATGKVSFDPSLTMIWGGHLGVEPGEDDLPLRFRPDSRLLIALGLPNEDQDQGKDGVYFFEWTGAKLKLLRFTPRAKACHVEPE